MSVTRETRDDADWITLDRPGSANALDAEMVRRVTELVEDPDERAVVLRGAGDYFCAGGDLETIASIDGIEDARDFAAGIVGLLRAVETADVPVVAAVNGDAFGAGLELVVASDLAVAAEDARFGTPAARMGLQPPLLVERVPDIGRKRVARLALTDEPVDASTAAEWGLVNRAVSGDTLEDEIAAVVSSVARTEPGAATLVKERISPHDDYDEIRDRMAERLAAPETRRRFRAAASEIVGDGT